ncbi:PleD family two-component system response regulator [Oceanicella actignis]|uniref:PleD family two-component system response regulator n=1 Tax=Oceanicella actignis TaxID=1189325 RepID=UPI0011E7DADD|nr:PleD family two-component system response regulator [Oceanicella actignis]TYO89672.1 two-component system cell cycle response regulator [Oceanicella actignis]
MSGRILVVDDVATNRMLLAARLGADYYDVTTAANGRDALEICAREAPDLVLLDVVMPELDGFEVCRRIKSDPLLHHIPVVMITALNEPEERVRGLEAGADDFLTKPVNELELNARVRNLLRMKMMIDEMRLRVETTQSLGLEAVRAELDVDVSGANVMIVAAEPDSARRRADILRKALDVSVRIPPNDREALTMAEAAPPDAFLIDRRLPAGGDGLRLVSALRSRQSTRASAIVLVAPEGDAASAAKGLDLGAGDYLFEPVDAAELVARMRSQLRRKRYADELRDTLLDGLRLAVTDPLTGLFNRRYAATHLQGLIRNARDGELGVMMMDIDRFKQVNDTYGHAAGDAVLREFARRLKANVRGADLTARLGGEEFLVAMPDARREAVAAAAERVRAAIQEPPFDIGDREIPVTVSIGVAMYAPGDGAESLIEAADAALYASKNGGRNRVTFRDAA